MLLLLDHCSLDIVRQRRVRLRLNRVTSSSGITALLVRASYSALVKCGPFIRLVLLDASDLVEDVSVNVWS